MTKKSLWGFVKGRPGVTRLDKIAVQARKLSGIYSNLSIELNKMSKLMILKTYADSEKKKAQNAHTKYMQYGDMGAEVERVVDDWRKEMIYDWTMELENIMDHNSPRAKKLREKIKNVKKELRK